MEMTLKEIKRLGYRIVRASPIEVGIMKGNKAGRTWWLSEFGSKMPSLDHPEIIKYIEREENEN